MSEEMEKLDGEVIEEIAKAPSNEELLEEVKNLRKMVKDYSDEIEHLKTDNTILKEGLIRTQLKSLGLLR